MVTAVIGDHRQCRAAKLGVVKSRLRKVSNMRVLLLADHCNPEFSSEPLVGYNTCRSIVEQVDEAVVVTQIRNRDAIGRAGMGGAEVVYLDTEYVARPLWKLSKALRLGAASSTVLKVITQYFFERDLWRRFGPDLAAGRFDIVHRVTPISSAIPCPLASWSPTPLVIGPVNGGLPYPPGFGSVLRKEGEWLRYIRGGWRLLPWAGATYSRPAAILAAFEHTIANLPADCHDRVIDMPETGADPARFAREQTRDWDGPLTFLFAGRLVPFKCADVAISAFAKSDILRQHRLVIVGDGPERPALEKLVAENDLQDCVSFEGWMPQEEVARHMERSHAFAFPSIRDAGAGAMVEAMMSGLAPVAVNYGPFRQMLTQECSMLVALGDRAAHVEGYRQAMERLAADPALCRRFGENARQRALDLFSWPARARKIEQAYDWALGHRAERPDFYTTDS